MIQIYMGDGKGKTTAAAGISIRCAGSGRKVLFCQFLKDGSSSECCVLNTIPGIVCMLPEKHFGFTFQMDEDTREKAAEFYQDYFDRIIKKAVSESYDMVVLDEIAAACQSGMVDTQKVKVFLEEYGQKTEIILTGRNPLKELLDQADYITEMKKIRHPYDRGIEARPGIEK